MNAIAVRPETLARRPIALPILRWAARLASLASIGTLALFILGELGNPKPLEWAALALFPFGVMGGMLFAWHRSLSGGLFALAALGAFYALALITRGNIPGGPWFLIFTSPAILFVIVGALEHRARPVSHRHSTSE
ncbi:MAG: hypothetical protein KF838_11875 [Phycisphaeraceae bacterium]|nr:MAG: hypothetical protein KF838_11875 [Phycisphaeraceae bacterium]